MKSVITLVLLSLCATAAPESQPVWQPARTWVFAVGVIQFDDPKLTSWPDKGRVDEKMIAAFRQSGVPEKQTVFLKNQEATKARTMAKLGELLKQTGPGDTLFFYYAGHGGRDYSDPKRAHTFTPYDTGTKWTVGSVVGLIAREFRGSCAILTADCCHSGSLGVEIARHTGRIGFATLTSAQATSTSTGNWTFTQCLVDMLNGHPAMDANHDGAITFPEAAAYTDAEMAFAEEQRADHRVAGPFPNNLLIAKTQGTMSGRVGERCEGLEGKTWYRAKIIAEGGGKFQVTWPGWDSTHDAWLAPDRLRPYVPALIAPSTAVEIEWNKVWYPGSVMKTELGLHLVHYDRYPHEDDEWVSRKRLRLAGEKSKGPRKGK